MYHKDIQGSTTTLMKEDGSVDASYEYTDFGEITVHGDNKAGNEVCYTGGIYDSTTGLYYLNARYYNPEDGRFLTEDTYRGETKEPDTWHVYAYCANNPVNYTDPSGHYPMELSVKMYWFSLSKHKKRINLANVSYINFSNVFKSRLKNSDRIYNIYKNLKKKLKKKKTVSFKPQKYIGFTEDKDLAYSVGHISDFYMSVHKKNSKQFLVKLSLKDTYDFAKFSIRKQGVIKTFVNNFGGYYPQKGKVVHPYKWSFQTSFYRR